MTDMFKKACSMANFIMVLDLQGNSNVLMSTLYQINFYFLIAGRYTRTCNSQIYYKNYVDPTHKMSDRKIILVFFIK